MLSKFAKPSPTASSSRSSSPTLKPCRPNRDRPRDWESKPKRAKDLGLRSFPPETLVTLMTPGHIDDPAYDDRGRCDGQTDTYPGEPFDYIHDYKLYAYKQQFDIMTFIGKQILTMKPNQNKVPQAALDKHLESEIDYRGLLVTRFGPLDSEGEEYRKLEESMRFAVTEEYNLWLVGSNTILEAYSFPGTDRMTQIQKITEELVSPYWGCDETGFLSDDDPRKIQTANVFKGSVEPFKVPRPKPKKFINRKTLQKYPQLRQLNGLAYIEPSGYIKNIPKKDHEIHKMVKILLRYPLGMCPSFLWNIYQAESKSNPAKIKEILTLQKLKSQGYSNFEELLFLRDDFFTVKTSTENLLLKKLIFPACRESIRSVNGILMKLHHKILLGLKFLNEQQQQENQLQKSKGVIKIPLDDVSKMVFNILRIRYSLEQWGFDGSNSRNTSLAFYENLLANYDSGFMKIEKRELIYYLKLDNKEDENDRSKEEALLESLEDAFGYSNGDWNAAPPLQKAIDLESRRFPGFPDFSEFVPVSTEIQSEGDYLRVGDRYYVRPDFMMSPLQFNVSLLQSMHKRDDFILHMTLQYNRWKRNKNFFDSISVSVDDVKVNSSHVAVSFEDEWVRGKIVEEATDLKGIFKLFLIDLGFYAEKVSVADMKVLHKDFAEFPAQIFGCSLQFKKMANWYGVTEDSTRKDFPKHVIRTFYDTLEFQVIGIIPLKRAKKNVDWEVKAFLIDSPETGNVIISDVLEALISLDLSPEEQEKRQRKLDAEAAAAEPSKSTDVDSDDGESTSSGGTLTPFIDD